MVDGRNFFYCGFSDSTHLLENYKFSWERGNFFFIYLDSKGLLFQINKPLDLNWNKAFGIKISLLLENNNLKGDLNHF